VLGYAVVSEQGVQQGTKPHPWGDLALRISVLPTLTTWGGGPSGRPGSSYRGRCWHCAVCGSMRIGVGLAFPVWCKPWPTFQITLSPVTAVVVEMTGPRWAWWAYIFLYLCKCWQQNKKQRNNREAS
jgi:hypothetical protein